PPWWISHSLLSSSGLCLRGEQYIQVSIFGRNWVATFYVSARTGINLRTSLNSLSSAVYSIQSRAVSGFCFREKASAVEAKQPMQSENSSKSIKTEVW